MPVRLYLMIAFAILIGAPLLVNTISGSLPGARTEAPGEAGPPPAEAAGGDSGRRLDLDPDAAPPPGVMAVRSEGGAGNSDAASGDAGGGLSTSPLADTAPSLDTGGIEPTVASDAAPPAEHASAPPPPAPPIHTGPSQAVVPGPRTIPASARY